MRERLHDSAYSLALKHHRAAGKKVFGGLHLRFRTAGFDALHQAAERGMTLRLASLESAHKVWGQDYPYEKARDNLRRQFSDFPEATVDRALSDAWTETR